jgi:tetratricopeptide (TPR) repeat protein
MKRTFIFALVLALTAGTWAVENSAVQTQSGPGVGRPHAQSQQELDDYNAAQATQGGATTEQAAAGFAQKYPRSELRSYLFAKAMREYQRENNPAGMLAMGEMVLSIDAGHPLALVLTATVLADNLAPGDADRDRKIAAIKRNAGRALQAVNDSSAPQGSAAQGQATLYKATLESMAYSALGIMRLKTGDYADAEKDLRTAVERAAARPDPYMWYHLALAQDHRKKYPAALNSVEQALQLASSSPDLQKLAESEHERLSRLTGRTKDSPDAGGSQPPQ